MDEENKKTFPNFDNVDLAILAILLIGLTGLIAGIIKDADLAVIIGFAATCVTGIAGLAKGKPTNGE